MGKSPREESQTPLDDLKDPVMIPLAENTGSNPLDSERIYGRSSMFPLVIQLPQGRDWTSYQKAIPWSLLNAKCMRE
jgi:hypothetical protein